MTGQFEPRPNEKPGSDEVSWCIPTVVLARFTALIVLFFSIAILAPRSAAAAGPITKGPWVQRVTSNSALVRIEVDPPGPVSIELGLGMAAGDGGEHRVMTSPDHRALHAIPVTGLEPSTHYSYSVKVGATSKFAAFTTAPRDDSQTAFHFLAYGDNRTDNAAHAAVVRSMVSAASDFVVHTGDFVEYGASAAQWQTFFDIEAPLLGARCIFACVGNHELTDGAGIEYARFFGPTDVAPEVSDGVAPPKKKGGAATVSTATRPEHFAGTFRWGNTRFFLLNGMVSFRAGSFDRTWLEKVLTDADAEANLTWRIVVLHHGPWSSGPHGNNQRVHDAGVIPLLKTHKVDLILSGHEHLYERGWAEPGIAYVVTGGGGAPVYKVKTPIPQSRKHESVRHFVDVAVNPSSLQLAATRVDGSIIERCALSRNATSWDCDEAAGIKSAAAKASAERASRSGESPRCACDVLGTPSHSHSQSKVVAVAAAALGICVVGARRRRRRYV